MSGIKLIRVQKDDCEDILLWRNDPLVRKYFFDTRIIAMDEHRKWFCERLRDPGTRMYIGTSGKDRIGAIRFETKDDYVDVSVYLRPEFTGKGMGAELVRIGTEQASRELGEMRPIMARIKRENIVSRKAFEKAGYKLVSEEGDISTYKRERA